VLSIIFQELCRKYKSGEEHSLRLWEEIRIAYTKPRRYYHNLEHLENVLKDLEPLKASITDWDTVILALCYHDVVYNPRKNDNEEKSALVARKCLQSISYPEEKIALCESHILATKGHVKSDCLDTNLFTDADLGILGSSWPVYHVYSMNIRREYKMYPDLLYKPGRRKVLEYFLKMERIYKSDVFHLKYEAQAKANLYQELDLLQ
jgi:predicted metal-dependent HD superfamily phosphohydrolase